MVNCVVELICYFNEVFHLVPYGVLDDFHPIAQSVGATPLFTQDTIYCWCNLSCAALFAQPLLTPIVRKSVAQTIKREKLSSTIESNK
jgi:hypothetical protein